MASRILLAIASLLVGLVAATPSISFPINSQVPPVARIDKPFSFVFSPSTFSSSSELTYTLAQSPDWISLDGKARRIYGTPKNSDVAAGEVVGVPLDIVATDNSGSVTMSATLVVSRNPPPTVSVPLSAQVPQFAPFSQPSSIIMRPDTSFDFDLASNTFTGALQYYAVMADNSPLPSWVTFDPAKLSFSGRTPPLAALVQTPQSFDFQLVASDVPGFSGAALTFSLVVGNHAVTAKQSFIMLNATVGERFSYKGLATTIKMDNQDAKSGGVSIVSTSGLPSWLDLNKNTWEISGTPQETAESSNFTIMMQDQHSNTLNLTLSVSITDGLFLADIPALNVTAGESFTLDLGRYLASKQDLQVSVTTNPKVDWVKYDAKAKVLSGDAPVKSGGSQLTISIGAKSQSSNAERTKQLRLSVLKAVLPTTLLTAPPMTATVTPLVYSGFSTSAPSTPTAESGTGQSDGKNKTKTILLAVLIPILLLALVLFGIVAFCIHRRRKRPDSIDRREISRPVPGSLTHSGSGSGPEMAQSIGTIDSYDTDDEIRPASYMARDMQGPYFTDASLLTPPPSRGGLHPSSGDAWPSSGAWAASSARKRSSNPHTPPQRPDIQGNYSAPNLNHQTDTPTRPPYNRHVRNRTSRHQSKILNVDIPNSNIFSADSTPDSSFFDYTNFDSSPPPVAGTITPPDRGTKLEDFIHAQTIRRVPTESSLPSSESSSTSLALPPLARLRTAEADTPAARPPTRNFHPTIHPRRLFAETGPPTEPPNMRSPSPPIRGGGPLSSSPWTNTPVTAPSTYYTYDCLGLPRSSPPRNSIRVRPAVRVESSVYSADNAGAITPSMSPSRWPHPPSSQERPNRLSRVAVSEEDEDDEDGLPPLGDNRANNVSAEDVNEWIGVATSRYSKASSWLEATAGFEGRASQDVERDGSSHPGLSSRPGTAGRSSGDYPVFI
jgi:hypothetical protein